MIFTVPVSHQNLTHNYQVRVASDRYVVDDSVVPISMHNCVLPSSHRQHTGMDFSFASNCIYIFVIKLYFCFRCIPFLTFSFSLKIVFVYNLG